MENTGLRNGLYLGGALVIVYFAHYMVSVKSVITYATMSAFVLEIIFVMKAIKEERRSLGGFITFGAGLGVGFLTFVVGLLIGTIFQWILYNYISPDFLEQAKEVTLESLDMIGQFISGDQLEAMEETLEKTVENLNYNLPTLLFGYLWKLIIPGFLIALIGAAIFKRTDKNEFE